MSDTHTPINPAMLDRKALLTQFWCTVPSPLFLTLHVGHITQGEVGEVLGVSQATVSRWLDNGTLPVLTEIVESQRRMIRASFDAWRTQTVTTMADAA